MSLTIGQANAVNTLLDHVLGINRPGLGVPTDEQAGEAAQLLITAAYKQLLAGLTPAQLAAAWADHDGAVHLVRLPGDDDLSKLAVFADQHRAEQYADRYPGAEVITEPVMNDSAAAQFLIDDPGPVT